MYRTTATIKTLFVAALTLMSISSCTQDDFGGNAIETPSTAAFKLNIAPLSGFADGGGDTRASGTTASIPDVGKTAWVAGDTILLVIGLQSTTDATEYAAITDATATYTLGTWVMNTGKHASDFGTLAIEDGILMLPPNTKLVEMMAFYAPFQKINADGELIAIDAATAGRYEQYRSNGTVSDNACTFGVWKVDCSRIRIAASTGIGNEFIRLTAAGFIPTGSKEPLTAADPILLATDSKLNAYVYGSWYDKDVVFQVETKAAAAADFKLVFQKTLTAAEFTDGKSYAFNAIGANDANTYMGSAAVFDDLYSNEAKAALAKDKWFLMDASVSDYAKIYDALDAVASADANRRISIEMPNCVTAVGSEAFRGCASLTSVSLPLATTVGANAFDGCTVLTALTFNTPITSWGAVMFGDGSTSAKNITLTLAPAQMEMGAKGLAYVPTANKFFDGTVKTQFGLETYKAIIAAPVR